MSAWTEGRRADGLEDGQAVAVGWLGGPDNGEVLSIGVRLKGGFETLDGRFEDDDDMIERVVPLAPVPSGHVVVDPADLERQLESHLMTLHTWRPEFTPQERLNSVEAFVHNYLARRASSSAGAS